MPLDTINPRHLREKYQPWLGKRVNVGLTTLHYICGVWADMGDDHATFKIGAHHMKVALGEIATITDATPWQADYFK
jgi:hypothetical protein